MLSLLFTLATIYLPACEYEDASELTPGQACTWHAETNGTNGTGSDFIAYASTGADPWLFYVYRDGEVWLGESVDLEPETTEPGSPADVAVGETWAGLLVGDAVICTGGTEPFTDVTPDGITWAGCA